MERKRKMFQDILPQETMPIASISAGKKIKFEEVDSCPKPSLKPASADGGLNDVLIALKTSKKHKSKK